MDYERRLLQITIGCACVVPILAGLVGIVVGPAMIERGYGAAPDQDSHFRYLSGLLLGIGLGFVSTIPRIEKHRARVLLLTGIVVIGGIGRLISAVASGIPAPAMVAALIMELVVTPALCLWQMRIARRVTSG